jgi:hypothetical protein
MLLFILGVQQHGASEDCQAFATNITLGFADEPTVDAVEPSHGDGYCTESTEPAPASLLTSDRCNTIHYILSNKCSS